MGIGVLIASIQVHFPSLFKLLETPGLLRVAEIPNRSQ